MSMFTSWHICEACDCQIHDDAKLDKWKQNEMSVVYHGHKGATVFCLYEYSLVQRNILTPYNCSLKCVE